MKRFLTILIFTCLSTVTYSQVLKNTNLNLNAGGVIYDVAYDSYYDAYVVVGEFTSINGQTRNNLAFVDASTFSLLPQAPIASIDGAIRSVEVVNLSVNNPTLGLGMRNYIYLGGNFTTVNTQNKVSIARLISTHYYSQPPVGGIADYTVHTVWDAELYSWASPEYGVHAFHLMGDTLIAVGEFNNVGASYLTGDYHRKAIAIDADNSTFLTKNITFMNGAIPFNAGSNEPLQGIEQLDDRLFLYGEADNLELINEYDLNGNFIQQIEYCNPNSNTVFDFEPHPSSLDTVLFSYESTTAASGTYYIASYLNDGTLWNCPGTSVSNTMLDFPNMGRVNYIESYKDYLFTAGANTNSLFTVKRNGTANVPILNSTSLNNNWYLNYPNLSAAPCLKVKDDFLFFSTNALSSVDGTTRTGLAVFCLEPRDAQPFTSFDYTACEGDSSIYTIPQAEFADGYRWTYSGTGVMYRTLGSSTWLPLSTEILSGVNMNSIEIYFPIGSTGGTLSVEPYSVCNTATDYQFSQGQSDVLTINAVPDILLDPTHSLNCYSDTALIVAQSSNSNVKFDWLYNGGGNTSTNDTILITPTNFEGFDSTYYVLTLTDTITGCTNVDSTFFTFDLTADPLVPSLVTTNPLEWNCDTDSMLILSNQSGFIVQWEDPASPGTFYPDPFTIYSTPNGSYNMHGIQVSNGCETQQAFGAFVVDTIKANGMLVGYNYVDGGTPIDTLTCANPSITIQCGVTAPFTANSTAEWLDASGTPTGSNQMTLSEQDANGASFIVRQFRTTNNDSGCTKEYNVLILCDFAPPLLQSMSDQTINCSQSEVVLTHSLSATSNVSQGWLDGSGSQTYSDTITATSMGEYYYQAISDTNGCMNVDTVSVTQSFDLLINMPQDTLICPNEVVTISPSVIGNTETPSFVWSTGSTNQSENATGGVDSELIVTVSTPSGCSGTDTTLILITAPVDVTVTAFVGCTDGSLEITNITGGSGNYQYSLDGTTWQTSTNFPSLSFGTYTVSIQDDLGCIYDTTALLNGTASTIDMLFAASTYNEEGDTIILVNITDFTGLDSVEWAYPSTANVTYEDDSVVILSMVGGGWYDIELIGYQGSSCSYSYTAPVFFGDHAPLFDDSTQQYGILEFDVLPNFMSTSTLTPFDVVIEFGTAQNYTILVTNSLGQPIPSMSVTGYGTSVSQTFNFPSSTAAGTYRVHVIADRDARQQIITLF